MRRMRWRVLAIVGAVLLTSGVVLPRPLLVSIPLTRLSTPTPPHIMVIIDENAAYASSDATPYVIGNARAPYINNTLVKTYASATKWYGVEHNSPKDYYDLISGLDQTGSSKPYAGTTLVDELASAGISWKAYMEDAPSVCYTGKNVLNYAASHNPFVDFASIVKNPSQCNNVVPYTLTQMSSDLNGTTPPAFVWITPNQCNDMHSNCAPLNNHVAQGDLWLKNNLPTVLASKWYTQGNGVVIITVDESVITDTSGGTEGNGGHIATLVLSAKSSGAFTSPGDHFATLRGIEEAYGVGLLGNSSNPAFGDIGPAFGGSAAPGTISGTVTDADTPQPNAAVANATVTCSCGGTPQTTGANGSYTFSGVTPGTYSLTVADSNPPGYVSQTANNVSVTSGGTTTQNVGLTEVDSISGTVTDAQTGTPITGASVSCSGPGGSSDCPNNNPASTSSVGFYYFTSTLPANYTLTVSATGYVTQAVAVTVPSGNQAAFQNIALNEVAPPPPSILQDVGSASKTAVTSFTVATSATSGNDLLAISSELAAGSGKHSGSITGITDSKGDVWTRAVAINPSTRLAAEIWYAPSASAGVTSVTVTFSKAVNPVVRFYEITGASTVDQTSSGSGTSKAPSSGTTGTTTRANEAVIGVIGFTSATATISGLPSGFSNDARVPNPLTSFNNSEQAGHTISSAVGAFSYFGTLSASFSWAAALATFR
jgi:hypothetical protein